MNFMCRTLAFLFIVLIGAANLFVVLGQQNEGKSYESPDYGFSLVYPKSWEVLPPRGGYSLSTQSGVVILNSPTIWDGDQRNMAMISICVLPLGKAPSDFARDYCHRRDDHLSDMYKNKTIASKQIKIAGFDAEKIETKEPFVNTNEEDYVYYVSFKTRELSFFVTGFFTKSPNKVWDTFKYEPEFDKIVGSIKLKASSAKN